IIRNDFDSFKTLISCVEIIPFCKSLISDNIGIITINNGLSQIESIPLNYNILFNDNNNIFIDTNSYDPILISSFLMEKSNILIAIHSNQTFNQELRSLLANIAHLIQPDTTICILYINCKNFLSRLYLNEFEKLSNTLNLTELYIFGDQAENEQLFDLVTFFRDTYIYNLKEINSLVITNTTENFYSDSITNIRTLVTRSPNSNLFNIFKNCPNIENINCFTLPSSIETETCKYTLPHAHSIHIQDFRPFVTNSLMIDGSQISNSLKISLASSVTDPTLTNLYFPNISSLQVKPDSYPDQQISLINCYFPNVTKINVENGIIPWKYLTTHIKNFTELSLVLCSSQQLKWLNDSPFDITTLKCLPSRGTTISNDLHSIEQHLLKPYSTLLINLDTLTQCQNLTKLLLNEQNLIPEVIMIMDNDRLQTEWDEYFYELNLPYINELKLLTRQKGTNCYNSAISDPVIVPSTYENHLPPRFLYNHLMLGIQPIFNHASIIPINNKENEPRDRNDSIDSVSSYQSINRRRSSAESNTLYSFTDTLTTIRDNKFDLNFDFGRILPLVLTTDFETLDNNKLSFGRVQNKTLSLLKMELHIFENIDSQDQLLTFAMRTISDAFNYPFSIKLPTLIIERIQFVLFFNNCKLSIEDRMQYYIHILQQAVRIKYTDLVVINHNDIPMDQYTVCISR
ncbi:hypothetical protein C6P45_000308, partial [Maudiozyma exigua]